MLKSLVGLAMMSAMTSPAFAQAAPANTVPNAVPIEKPQTIKKVVCRRVPNEETTGSRLGSAPKVCKTVEVPAPRGSREEERAPAQANPERG